MPLKVQCSHCETQYRAPAAAAGKTIPCPACGGSIVVPAAPPPETAGDNLELAAESPPEADPEADPDQRGGSTEQLKAKAGPPQSLAEAGHGSLLDELTDDELTGGDSLAAARPRPPRSRQEPGTPQHPAEPTAVSPLLQPPPREARVDKSSPVFADFGSCGLIGLAGVLLVLVCLAGLPVLQPEVRATIGFIIMAIGALGFYGGVIWCFVLPFYEDVVAGLLCLFIPPVIFYFIVSRFATMWRPVAVIFAGFAVNYLGSALTDMNSPNRPDAASVTNRPALDDRPKPGRTRRGAGDVGAGDRRRVEPTVRPPSRPLNYRSVPVPHLPSRPALRSLVPGVQYADVTITPTPGRPGQSATLYLYVPEGDHPPRSLPCVLIAAAGGTAISGMRLSPGDRVEHLPYVRDGFAVVAYEVDGELASDSPTDAQMQQAYKRFRAASAGMVNARNALRYATTHMPEVDPNRLYLAGHSSAGTLALLVASFESRLAGVAAYAPVSDNVAQVQSEAAVLNRIVPGSLEFVQDFCPTTRVARIRCPVFLFHAEGDRVVPVQQSRDFAKRLEAQGTPVIVETVPGGDHYDSMIAHGIPAGIAWMKLMDELFRLRARARLDHDSGPPTPDQPGRDHSPPEDHTDDNGPQTADTSQSKDNGDSQALVGPAYDKASREYLRNAQIDLIAGDDAVLERRLGWVPVLKRPAIGVRWGLGVYVSGLPQQPLVTSKEQLVQWTGLVGPLLVTQLQKRIDNCDFGQWPPGPDARFRQVVPLGGGNFATLREAAQNKGIDAFLMLTVTRQMTAGARKQTNIFRCRVADVDDQVTPWTSGSVNSEAILAAGNNPANPLVGFINEILAHIEENYRLEPMPALTPELARKRADSLAELDDLSTLHKLIELRYYHARGWLADAEAAAAADHLLGSPRGQQVLLGDERQRRTVLQDVDHP